MCCGLGYVFHELDINVRRDPDGLQKQAQGAKSMWTMLLGKLAVFELLGLTVLGIASYCVICLP